MSVADTIRTKLEAGLRPVHIEVDNESHMHSVPKGSETHFKVLVVSEAFTGMGPVERHRAVNALLSTEFSSGLHALSLRTLTPEQWSRQGGTFESPKCLGGSKSG